MINLSSKTNIKMQNKDILFFIDKYFIFFVILLMIIILAAGYFFLFKNQIDQIKEKKAQYIETQDIIENNRLSILELNKKNEGYNQISAENKNKVLKMLPHYQNIEELYPTIEAIIKKNGVIIQGLTVNYNQEDKLSAIPSDMIKDFNVGLPSDINIVSIVLNIKGIDYYALKNLLNSLENNIPILNIGSLSFDPQGLTANLTAFTYFYK